MKSQNHRTEQRSLHPIVDRYVTTDIPLSAIVETHPRPHAPLLSALTQLLKIAATQPVPAAALNAAQSADLKGADPELAILFLSRWASAASRSSGPSEAEALIHRARALITDATHPEVVAAVTLVEANLADLTGNKARTEQLLKEVIAAVPTHSPRRKLHLWDLGCFLAFQGRCSECSELLKELAWQCNEQFPMARVLLIRFVNAVETGHVREASSLMPDIAANPRLVYALPGIPYRGYQALLRLMHATTEHGERTPSPPTPAAAPPAAAGDPPWVQVAAALLARDTDRALRTAREEANRTLGALFGSGFLSLNLIRAELAAGTPENARRLLAMRQSRGNRHYLDDFFLARAELLTGNRRLAQKHFADAVERTDVYDAQGRLDFELRLACELAPGDLVFLSKVSRSDAPTAATASPTQTKPSDAAGQDEPDGELTPLDSEEIVGRGSAMAAVTEAIGRYADLDAPVLVSGETGTGKELVARALHRASRRHAEPFLAINCGTIHENLLESELFGHERGAFTGAERATKGVFEEAGKGTVFLDEIGDISPRLQGALLRLLETREIRAVGSSRPRTVQCRIVAATNANIESLVKSGRFRGDLMFRFQRLGIHIPPLRERREDIPALARHFLDLGRPMGIHATLSKALAAALEKHNWPGNVRELRNVIERMRLLHSDKLAYDLPDLDLKFAPVNAGAEEPVARAAEPETGAPRLSVAAIRSAMPTPAAPAPAGLDIEAILLASRSQIRRLDQMRELFRRYGKLTRDEIIRILGVSPNTATKDLKALCDENFIVRVEPSASSRSFYFTLKTPPA
jgi:DNA-binding NtrC family response regulator